MQKSISIEDYNTRFPKLNEEMFDGLTKEEKETYMMLYSAYSEAFRDYIIKKLNLKIYDNDLLDSPLNFKENDEEQMDLYQSITKDNLKYIYIRNNLYIERLTYEERTNLLNMYLKKSEANPKQIEKFVEDTYKKVIFEDISKSGEIRRINYGPDNPLFFASNNSLVLGINYDEFSLNGLTDDEWSKQHDEQGDKLVSLVNNIINNESDKLDVPLRVILYNEYSIKKKVSDSKTSKNVK